MLTPAVKAGASTPNTPRIAALFSAYCAFNTFPGALRGVLDKAKFWERVRGVAMNDRQRLVLNKLLDGFEGKLTTTKYAKLTKSSPDTALRDIAYLVDKGVLARSTQGGRSTSYTLKLGS